MHQMPNTIFGMLKLVKPLKCLYPLPVDFAHDAVLESHGDHGSHHQGGADKVGPVSWDVEYSHLKMNNVICEFQSKIDTM